MKKFDGLHPFSYETLFGIIQIDKEQRNVFSSDGYTYVLTPVTVTCIKLPVIVYRNCIGMRRFQNKTQAYLYIKALENQTVLKIKQLMDQI